MPRGVYRRRLGRCVSAGAL